MKVDQLFEIVYLLMNKGTITAGELARHFEVSTRTIYRYVDALSMAGIPICTTRGRGGGISLMDGFTLSKSVLNAEEQCEILAALHGLSALEAADPAMVLNRLSVLFNRDVIDWLKVDFSGWDGRRTPFALLKKAILEKRLIEFDYYNTAGQNIQRRVEPLQLHFKHRDWYLKGFCLSRGALRLFKLSRIREPVLTDTLFQQREFMTRIYPEDPRELSANKVTLHLRIAPQMAHRVYDEFSPELVTNDDRGYFRVTVTWPEDDWVYGFLLSYGEHLEVLKPARVRVVLSKKLAKMSKIYT